MKNKEWILITSNDDIQSLLHELYNEAEETQSMVKYDHIETKVEDNLRIMIIDRSSKEHIKLYALDADPRDPSIANLIYTDGNLDFG